VELPLGLSLGAGQIKGLDKNPLTRAKIELGRQLYFDPRLSSDGSVSCASCHHPDTGWAARTQFGVGIGGQTGGRNSPVSFNRILSDFQFWDGRASSLEAQAIGPIANPIEMGNTHEACVDTLKKVPGYELEFNRIFGELTIEAVGKAIASFERAVVTGPSPYDYYERFLPLAKQDQEDLKTDDPELYNKYLAYKKDMNENPMSESAIRGRHVGPNFSDELYHNLGIGMDKPEPDVGREAITKNELDRGAFKTPTIRNVALSGPFMHDGSLATLEDVVEWYNKGGFPNPYLDLKIKKLNLNDQEKEDLVEFMKACEGPFPTMERGRLPE
jgi:cytochrome c peroxidase